MVEEQVSVVKVPQLIIPLQLADSPHCSGLKLQPKASIISLHFLTRNGINFGNQRRKKENRKKNTVERKTPRSRCSLLLTVPQLPPAPSRPISLPLVRFTIAQSGTFDSLAKKKQCGENNAFVTTGMGTIEIHPSVPRTQNPSTTPTTTLPSPHRGTLLPRLLRSCLTLAARITVGGSAAAMSHFRLPQISLRAPKT